VLLSVKEK
jgi:hypothetical protein